jgi:hypothetical protein
MVWLGSLWTYFQVYPNDIGKQMIKAAFLNAMQKHVVIALQGPFHALSAIIWVQETSDKGKPGESRRRKAMGLPSRK